MVQIIVTDRGGETRTIEADVGISVMENLRDNGIEDVFAICGGCCSCATCHVYVADDWFDRLPAREEDEQDLVSETEHFRPANSRLSCQIEMTEALSGLSVTVAPEE